MTATVHIERPENDPYKVVLIHRQADGSETILAEIKPGQRHEHIHAWKGMEIVIREVDE